MPLILDYNAATNKESYMKKSLGINHETLYMGLLGYPLQHSFSVALQNQTLEKLSLNAVYLPLETRPGDLETAVKAISCFRFVGVNVTIPFKESVMPLLQEITPAAAEIGAVNVVKAGPGKPLIGYNTDGMGFMAALKEESIEPEGKKALIVGAGGGARAAAVSIAKAGLKYMEIYDRDISKSIQLAQHISQAGSGNTKIQILSEIRHLYKVEADLLINCTPVGMFPDIDQNPLSDVVFTSPDTVLFDLIYNPQETRFMEMGRKQGLKAVNGLQMFIYQAAYSLSLLLEIPPPVEIMKSIMGDILA